MMVEKTRKIACCSQLRKLAPLFVVILGILLIGCSEADDTRLPASDGTVQPADTNTPPDRPKGIYVDLNGDGVPELLPDNVEDRRVEYRFGHDERPDEQIERFPDDDPNEIPDPHDTGPDDSPKIEFDDELFIEIPAVVKEAGTDSVTCVTGTWNGPDIGIVNSHYAGDEATNHHLLIFGLPDGWADHVADGELFPCDFDSDNEHIVTPLYTWSEAGRQGIGERLKHGQRYYLELHTVNIFPHPILVNGGAKLLLRSLDTLKGISAPFMLGPNEVIVKPGDYHIKFTYEWPADISILLLQAHLHEYGKWFAIDWTSAQGTKRILEVDPWKHKYVSINAPGHSYGVDEFKVSAGDTFTTHCRWFNPTNADVKSPEEMCNSFGVAIMDNAIDQDMPFQVVKD